MFHLVFHFFFFRFVYRWGRTPVDEARVGGDVKLVKLLQDAKVAQMSEFCTDINK